MTTELDRVLTLRRSLARKRLSCQQVLVLFVKTGYEGELRII